MVAESLCLLHLVSFHSEWLAMLSHNLVEYTQHMFVSGCLRHIRLEVGHIGDFILLILNHGTVECKSQGSTQNLNGTCARRLCFTFFLLCHLLQLFWGLCGQLLLCCAVCSELGRLENAVHHVYINLGISIFMLCMVHVPVTMVLQHAFASWQ